MKYRDSVCYVKVSKDKYELIEAIADSPTELADMCGVSVNNINSCISRGNTCYKKIILESDEHLCQDCKWIDLNTCNRYFERKCNCPDKKWHSTNTTKSVQLKGIACEHFERRD